MGSAGRETFQPVIFACSGCSTSQALLKHFVPHEDPSATIPTPALAAVTAFCHQNQPRVSCSMHGEERQPFWYSGTSLALAVPSLVPHLAEPEGRGASLLHPAQCMIEEARNGGVCSEVHTPILFVSAAVLLINCLFSIRPRSCFSCCRGDGEVAACLGKATRPAEQHAVMAERSRVLRPQAQALQGAGVAGCWPGLLAWRLSGEPGLPQWALISLLQHPQC